MIGDPSQKMRLGAFARGPYAVARSCPSGQLNIFGSGPSADIRYSINLDSAIGKAGASAALENRFRLGGERFVVRHRLAIDGKLGANAGVWINLHLSPKTLPVVSIGGQGFAGARAAVRESLELAHVTGDREERLARVGASVSASVGAGLGARFKSGDADYSSGPFSFGLSQTIFGFGIAAEQEVKAGSTTTEGHALAGVGVTARVSGDVNPLNIAKTLDSLLGGSLGVHRTLKELQQTKRAAFGRLERIAKPQEAHPAQRRSAALDFVARMGVVSVEHLARRFATRPGEDPAEARARTEAMIKRLQQAGLVRTRTVLVDGANVAAGRGQGRVGKGLVDERIVSITPKAIRELNLPKPPTVREAFIGHHLKTLDALLQVEQQLQASGNQVLGIKTEDELVRDWFRGKHFAGQKGIGDEMPKFPDGAVIVAGADGQPEQINLEYATTKYSNAMIAEKAKSFVGRTVWAVDRASTARRVETLTGEKAVMV